MNILSNLFRLDFSQLPFIIISLVIAFSVHEFSHAFVAYQFGDATAKNQGRLTLNPIVHLDPIGTLMILFIGFGWAKPVPVNRFHFKNPRLAGLLVSLAGPVSNLIIAFIGLILWGILVRTGVLQNMPVNGATFTRDLLGTLVHLNILLFVFNLLPIPPLDGFRILQDLVPLSVRPRLTILESYGSLIFLVLLFVPSLYNATIGVAFRTFIPMVSDILHEIVGLFL